MAGQSKTLNVEHCRDEYMYSSVLLYASHMLPHLVVLLSMNCLQDHFIDGQIFPIWLSRYFECFYAR